MNRIALVLRLTAAVALVQGLAHGLLHVSYHPSHGPVEEALVGSMQHEFFRFGGFERTYWGFYFGYGLMAVVTCVIQAVALWLIAELAQIWPRKVAPLITLYAVAYALHAVLAWHYFFAKPVVFDGLVTVGLGTAAYLSWNDRGQRA